MALTVNLKPAGFRPVGGIASLLYKFTEASLAGKANYRVQIEMNGLTVPILEFRPDSNLVIWADISIQLRAALKTPPTTLAQRFTSSYVKYQAVWDGGFDAQVPLNGDVIYFYSGVDQALNHRTKFQISASGGQFLIPTTKLYAWLLRTAYVDFLNDSDLAADSEVLWVPDTGSPVQLLAFNGTVKNLQTVGYKFTGDGVVRVKKISAPATVYASIRVEILPECKNPIYLKWLNDLGGYSQWLFDYDQRFDLTPYPDYRYKTLDIHAMSLSLEQWLMLMELEKDGISYGDNLKSGVELIDFTTEASPINVYTIPQSGNMLMRQRFKKFDATIRYPKISNALV